MSRAALRMLITLMAGIAATLAASFVGVAQGADVRTTSGPGIHAAPKPGTWIQVAATDSGFNEAGMLRTANGNLHLVWRKRLGSGKFAYGWTTISPTGQPLTSGTALSGWTTLEGDPRLVPNGSGLRLIFIGGLRIRAIFGRPLWTRCYPATRGRRASPMTTSPKTSSRAAETVALCRASHSRSRSSVGRARSPATAYARTGAITVLADSPM